MNNNQKVKRNAWYILWLRKDKTWEPDELIRAWFKFREINLKKEQTSLIFRKTKKDMISIIEHTSSSTNGIDTGRPLVTQLSANFQARLHSHMLMAPTCYLWRQIGHSCLKPKQCPLRQEISRQEWTESEIKRTWSQDWLTSVLGMDAAARLWAGSSCTDAMNVQLELSGFWLPWRRDRRQQMHMKQTYFWKEGSEFEITKRFDWIVKNEMKTNQYAARIKDRQFTQTLQWDEPW